MAVSHFSCFSFNCMKIQKLSLSSGSKFKIIVLMFGNINYKLQYSLMIQIEMLMISLIKRIYNLNIWMLLLDPVTRFFSKFCNENEN